MKIRLFALASLIAVALALSLSSGPAQGQGAKVRNTKLPLILDTELEKKATSAAVEWCKAINRGDVEAVLSYSEVPFAFNGGQIIETRHDLEIAYRQFIDKKGKHDVQIADARVTSSNSSVMQGCVPACYFIVGLAVPADQPNVSLMKLPVCIKPENCKVIGFGKYSDGGSTTNRLSQSAP